MFSFVYEPKLFFLVSDVIVSSAVDVDVYIKNNHFH